jgi:hypothetical protein
MAAGAALGGYTLWRFLRRPSLSSALVAGWGTGLLQNTKFTALLFLPLFRAGCRPGPLAAVARRSIGGSSLVFVVYPAAALLTLWAANGLQVGALREPLPLLGTLGGAAVPLSHHLDRCSILAAVASGHTVFPAGAVLRRRLVVVLPVAFVLKTPLPVLLLLLMRCFA